MNNIDDILQRLQEAEQPVIDNPDELTERIMKETHPLTLPVRKGRRLRAAFERSKALPLTGERGEGLTPSLPLGACDASSSNSESEEGRVRGWSSLLIIRTVLSLAALWIIGFFIYLQFESVTPTEAKVSLPFGGDKAGASTLKDVYKDYLCQDCKNTISYTQLRNKLYENK